MGLSEGIYKSDEMGSQQELDACKGEKTAKDAHIYVELTCFTGLAVGSLSG